ncbi:MULTISPECIES: ATP-binding protein [unclassified Psychrobacillus]|uniref:ATP-binding protein n=1 Tax=unclassified Psychrobacillus TaxID=2636677 RepID=UPI00146C4F3A|nr:ATP-binding protein [Psychrobacillus sp. BL-248-WT-3]NME06893.1 ATP-binding protein [Psychrobacillus sp. BL-248-WT-3]
MKNDRFIYLKGYQVRAEYKEQIVPESIGNPFIEALPNRLSREELYDLLYSVPRFNGNIDGLDDEDRIELVQQIKPSFWLPLSSHFNKYRNLYSMIKIGYQSRNPMTPLYHRYLSVGYDKILEHGTDEKGLNLLGQTQTAQQCAEIGLSGMGKSKSYDKLLSLIPQVIHHTSYKNNQLTCKQVVWLKIECPSNKSIGALCRNFYTAVDDLLGTTYYEDLAEKDGRIEVLAKRMAKVAGLINLGILVIDEIQRVNRAHSGGDEKMIDFITELTNSIGIPIVIIGTFKALYIFKSSLANTRRGVSNSYGENITDRMKDEWEWEQFIESLWDLQYTKSFTEITPEIKSAMYYHTIGIPDFAVKLFMHVQSHAILYSDTEKIDVEMIESVANKTLRLVQPIFERIRNGEEVNADEFDDLKPDWISFNSYLMDIRHRIQIDGQMSEEHKRILLQRNKRILIEQLTSFATRMGCTEEEAKKYAIRVERENNGSQDNELLYAEMAKLVLENNSIVTSEEVTGKSSKSNKRRKKNLEEYDHDDLRFVVFEGLNTNKTTDEALRDAGLVSLYEEFVLGKEET